MPQAVQTRTELRDLLVAIIVGTVGGEEDDWRTAVGEIEKLPIATNVRSNWRIRPNGMTAQKNVIRRAGKVVRAAYPYVAS